MDALDLTTGERLPGLKFLPKGSRRKATTPQRRQHSEGEDKDISEDLGEDGVRSLDGKEQDGKEQTPPPRPSSEGPAEPTEVESRTEATKQVSSTHEGTNIFNDLAQKILNSREKLSQPPLVPFDRERHFPLNLNNSSPANSHDTATVDSEGGQIEFRPAGELPLSLLASSGPLPMDDLMQQRLRRYLDDVQPAEAPGIPERTKKQNRWAFNVWREWARKRNMMEDSFAGPYKGVPLDVGQASEEELDYWLCKFVMEIRRKDGNPYPPHTLMQIVMGIQRYLRQQAGKPTICILDRSNTTYSSFRSVLDYRIKELTNSGATSMKSNSRPSLHNEGDSKYGRYLKRELFALDRPERDAFDWKNAVMNTETAQGLLNAVFWHNHKTFGIQYIDDHWNLRAENFQIHGKSETGGSSYLQFTPSPSSMMAAAGKANGMRVAPKKIYSDVASEREVFVIYQKYLSHIPKTGPFYRHPVDPTIVDRSIRFSDQWVGKNRLRAMLKHLMEVGSAGGRLKTYNAASRYSASPVESYVTPMMQLPRHPAGYSPSVLPDSLEVIKPSMRVQQSTPVSGKEQDDDSFNDIDSAPPSPKRLKSDESKNVASGSNGSNRAANGIVDDDALEIAVPRTIKCITVIKGGRKITFHLD